MAKPQPEPLITCDQCGRSYDCSHCWHFRAPKNEADEDTEFRSRALCSYDCDNRYWSRQPKEFCARFLGFDNEGNIIRRTT